MRYREMQGDAGRCREMQGDAGRCREMQGDMGTCLSRRSIRTGRRSQPEMG
jgi:hypothetical protein